MKLNIYCMNGNEFYNKNKKLLVCPNFKQVLTEIKDFSELNNNQIDLFTKHGWLIKENGLVKSTFPILNQSSCIAIEKRVEDWLPTTIELLSKSLSELKDLLKNQYSSYIHNIVLHIILDSLWQQLWLKIIKPVKKGCIVLVKEEHELNALFTNIAVLNNNLIMLYGETSLQHNNKMMCNKLNNKYMIRLLCSVDNSWLVYPYDQQEFILMEMNLVKRMKIKGSIEDYFKLTIPIVNKKMITEMLSVLKQVSVIGYNQLKILIKILNKNNRTSYIGLDCVYQEDYLQASFFVIKHAIVKALICNDCIPDFVAVPYLNELTTRLLYKNVSLTDM